MEKNPDEITRRDFLKTTARSGAGLAALGGVGFVTQAGRVLGANDRVRVAICGLRGRGFDHIKAFAKIPGVEIAAVAEVDENVLRRRLSDMDRMGLPKPATFIDVRKLMEDKSIDAVSIATPNHWHSLIGIWACQAGKDVYVEKPCSHDGWEGLQLVRATKKYRRIVQHGTQSRSSQAVKDAIQKMRDGLVGDVYLSRGLCYKWRDTIGHTPVEPVPTGVHYGLWTGPAPLHPFTRNHFHYNWHWFWDYGNGDLGNQGIHELDVARWGLGVKFPNKISALGGHFLFKDDQQTPNVLNCAYEFDMPDGSRRMLEFEVRGWMTNHEAAIGTGAFHSQGVPAAGLHHPAPQHQALHQELGPVSGAPGTIGNIFYGSKGYLAIQDYDSYKTWLGESQEPGPRGVGGGNHFANFIDCVRSRNSEGLNAPIEEGYISCTLVHLANVSYRLGRTLHYDPDHQQVLGDEEASRMLHGACRAPFVVPDEV
ncbi:MAG: Gfo/Idh/MocA family oxidoreductase [Terriglobia bacterium]